MYTYSIADREFIKHIVYHKEVNGVFTDFKYKDYINVCISNLRLVLNKSNNAK